MSVGISKGATTQYDIIMFDPSSNSAARKAIKVKTKAKAINKTKILKPKRTAIAHAYVVENVGVDPERVRWFMQIDYGATSYVCSNDDSRCPPWCAVKSRRTYNLCNG